MKKKGIFYREIDAYMKARILHRLSAAKGNVSRAAEALELNRTTLIAMMRRLNIKFERGRDFVGMQVGYGRSTPPSSCD